MHIIMYRPTLTWEIHCSNNLKNPKCTCENSWAMVSFLTQHISSFNCSQVIYIDTALAFSAWGCKFESLQFYCSHKNWVCLKFPWTRYSLLIVLFKLEELIWYALDIAPLVVAAVPDFKMVFHGMVYFGQQWSAASVKCAEAAWNYKAGDVCT